MINLCMMTILYLNFLCMGANSMETTFEINPDAKCYSVGVPVVLDLSITNNGLDAVVFDLGTDRKGGLQIVVENQGQKIQVPKYEKGGICMPSQVHLNGAASHKQKIILDEFYLLQKPGHYKILITIKTVDGVELKAETNLDVFPPLEHQLRMLWEELGNPKTSPERIVFLKLYLASGRHPDFIIYQRQLLSKPEHLSLQEITRLVAVLLESGDKDSLKLIHDAISTDTNHSLRATALYQLSQRTKDWWTTDKNKFFEEFKEEIKSSAPIDVGD